MRTWKCPKCNRTVEVGYEEIVEIGTPLCQYPDCQDQEMELQDNTNPTRIIAQVEGGCVVAIMCSDPTANADILDYDNQDEGDEDENTRIAELEKKCESLTQVA